MSRYSRQGFLGSDSVTVLAGAKIGIIGLGGGGSHVAQQAAHVGIGKFLLVDPQRIEDSNANRLVGATHQDVLDEAPKVDIAERLIRRLRPEAQVDTLAYDWRNVLPALRTCDVIVGAVDSLAAKDELETFARDNLIPYVDMGMTVTAIDDGFLISGQVIRSIPSAPCMRCLGFTTDAKLAREARAYGDAGDNPQVIWSNGILASAAMGLVVDLLTPWCTMPALAYLIYDGNAGILRPSELVKFVGETCPHHPAVELGEPGFRYDPGEGVGIDGATTDVEALAAAGQAMPTSGFWSRILIALFRRKRTA